MNILIIKIFSFIIAIASVVIQAVSIKKGQVKQPQLSWILWFIVGVFVAYLNYTKNGFDITTITLSGLSIGNLSILVLLWLNPQIKWLKIDTILLLSCLTIFIGWISVNSYNTVTNDTYIKRHITEISLVLLHIPHLVGVVRHWAKVNNDPFTESLLAWSLRFIAFTISIIGLITTNSKNIAWFSPVYGIITTGILLLLIIKRRKKLVKE